MDAGPTKMQRLLGLARTLFMPMALLFLVLAAYSARSSFQQALALAQPAPVVLALVAWSATHLLAPAMVHRLLASLGGSPGYAAVLRTHLVRLPARYLPGGVWHTVARFGDLHALGIGKRQLSAMVALENLVPLALALAGAGACLLASGADRQLAAGLVLLGGLMLAGLPGIARRIAGVPVAWRHYLAALVPGAVFWTVAALAFGTYWSAFPSAAGALGLLDVAAAYLLAWAAGFVAVFAPQGIGVFEAVAAWQLEGALPFAGVAVLVAGFRATTLAGDALAYAVFRVALLLRGARDAN